MFPHSEVRLLNLLQPLRALARNCNASLDKNKGNESKDWKAGKPVRVVRNCKGRKHSKYAPEDGNRYDGIYKVMHFLLQSPKYCLCLSLNAWIWRFVSQSL